MARIARWPFALVFSVAAVTAQSARAEVTSGAVEQAIRDGIRFVRGNQAADGSWRGVPGITELATLALLTAGVPPDDPDLARAIALVRQDVPSVIPAGHRTYTVALHAMVLAAADPEGYRDLIARDAAWLVGAQMFYNPVAGRGPGRVITVMPAGAWTYHEARAAVGDNSNTQYALLGLNAAAEAGVPIATEVWQSARLHWLACQQPDGGWAYRGGTPQSSASMTTAGVSSLIITGSRLTRGNEVLSGSAIRQCGSEEMDIPLRRGVNWLGTNFSVQTNLGGHGNTLYYLYGLERAGRLAGTRYFGVHDWYREGAEALLGTQNQATGAWSDTHGPVISTCFALLFLAKGRTPVLVNKLRHGPGNDWNNDGDDIRNLVSVVSRDWKHLLTWQVVDPEAATTEDMLQAPIVYFNGHQGPVFGDRGKKNLRDFVEQGGFVLADACCGRAEFDQRFRTLMKEIFPEPGSDLHLLGREHAIWRARNVIDAASHPLWGIELGCRTVVVYSPEDLSCFWNQEERSPTQPAVVAAVKLAQNIVDYATGREMPDDKLAVHDIKDFQADAPRRGALRIAKLEFPGEWNVAPRAIPNLMEALHRPPLNFDVVLHQRDLSPRDPSLVHYPLIYMHGRASFDLNDDMVVLRRHLEPGGGTIFADAACGSPAFDAAFRQFIAALLPRNPLVPIPRDHEIYTQRVGFDLSHVQYSPAAGNRRDFPELEGVELDGHWAVIYSKYDLGCALDHNQPIECKGYTHESALRIAGNIVIYSTLP